MGGESAVGYEGDTCIKCCIPRIIHYIIHGLIALRDRLKSCEDGGGGDF